MEIQFEDEELQSYINRNKNRENRLNTSTVNFINYFVNLGDDITTARNKVSELSNETAQYIYVYILGNTTPLINCINNSTLPFMDDDAKAKLVGDLTNFS